ncbi:AraC family transcriptional regulator [Rhizobium sp. SSA_523]|uniref:helix-turn-helix domain-containing protein n=1 Tax=Rhizobium sp. SSA_523 TaxID=2952477 RepID=UPI0020910ABF|nr:AraC family transcriptional regulator [Rhizobium sp. SSA_523]MCO5734217.1 AraC family transcriptional regulator [Rhizobium sp. SSA_523]WKC21504.1 AraC family transcriptional regulator [Rhizobium sp. SSA_523]
MSTMHVRVNEMERGGEVHPAALLTGSGDQVAHLLAKAMSLAEREGDAALDLVRRAANLVGQHSGIDRPVAPAVQPQGGLAPWQAERVRRFIDADPAARMTSDDLARLVRLSTSYFSAAFKVSFGTSPHNYICRRRVGRAKDLMLESNAALCEIALDCGFADQSHLSRVFRRVTGTTPAAWRRQRRIHRAAET